MTGLLYTTLWDFIALRIGGMLVEQFSRRHKERLLVCWLRLMHGDWQAPWPGGAISFASRFLLALIFAGLFVWCRSLKVPIVLHWLIDAVAVISE